MAEALAKFAAMQTGLKSGDKPMVAGQTEPKKEGSKDPGETERNKDVERKTAKMQGQGSKGSKTERKKTHAKMAVKKLHQRAVQSTGTG